MKIQKISLFAVCIFAHAFTQPATTFAGKFASAFTKKNFATAAKLAATEIAVESLINAGNPISDGLHKKLTDITRYFSPKRQPMNPGESAIISKGEAEITCHTPTENERDYLIKTLQYHPDNLTSKTIQDIVNSTWIADDLDRLPENQNTYGFYCHEKDICFIKKDLLENSNRSKLLGTIMHENTHRNHRNGHAICEQDGVGFMLYAIPAYFQIRKTMNPFSLAAAAGFFLFSKAFNLLIEKDAMRNEEERADYQAFKAASHCAGCAEKIVSNEAAILEDEEPGINLPENKSKRHSLCKNKGLDTGYIALGLLSDPERKFPMQSCDLCLPKPTKTTQPIKQAEPIELK